jgi:hypothetical protein
MNKNPGKELARMLGEVSEKREYSVRKRDWLDRVGEFLDDEPVTNEKDGRFDKMLRLAPLGLVLGVAGFCSMDHYHWNVGKFSMDALRAMPFGVGKKMVTKEFELIVPAYRVKSGETTEETQRSSLSRSPAV